MAWLAVGHLSCGVLLLRYAFSWCLPTMSQVHTDLLMVYRVTVLAIFVVLALTFQQVHLSSVIPGVSPVCALLNCCTLIPVKVDFYTQARVYNWSVLVTLMSVQTHPDAQGDLSSSLGKSLCNGPTKALQHRSWRLEIVSISNLQSIG